MSKRTLTAKMGLTGRYSVKQQEGQSHPWCALRTACGGAVRRQPIAHQGIDKPPVLLESRESKFSCFEMHMESSRGQ